MKNRSLFLPLSIALFACGSSQVAGTIVDGAAIDAPDRLVAQAPLADDASAVGEFDGAGDPGDAGDLPTSSDGAAAADGGSSGETVGTGNITAPAQGPRPSQAAAVGGAPFVLVKNWDFGTNGTIRGTSDLIAEFQFHDQFSTIANGTKYGGVIVAPTKATSIGNLSSNLNLPNNTQPVEDPSRPTRLYTADTIQCRVQPLAASQTTCSATKHDVGVGSFFAKLAVML
jgi:hypothetical protein